MEIAREYDVQDHLYGESELFKWRYCKIILKGAEDDGSDLCESIDMAIQYWTEETYEKQWQIGLERIKTRDTSCLIASIQDPKKGPFINCWVLYKIGDKIHIRNSMFFNEVYEKAVGKNILTPENCYDFIIRPYNKDELLGGWVVSVD